MNEDEAYKNLIGYYKRYYDLTNGTLPRNCAVIVTWKPNKQSPIPQVTINAGLTTPDAAQLFGLYVVNSAVFGVVLMRNGVVEEEYMVEEDDNI